MSNADTTTGLSNPPDPPQDRPGKFVPPHMNNVCTILHILLIYARHLSLTLDRRSTAWGFSGFAQFFGTARLPVIRARLARGILRIMALQHVLLGRARRGRELRLGHRERTQPQTATPVPPAANAEAAPQSPTRKRVRRTYADTTPDLDNLPTIAQLEAEIRRRGIGATLADICRDLGVSPSLCEGNFWTALMCYIRWCRGNFTNLMHDLDRNEVAFERETNSTPPLCLPEKTREVIRRMLGFFIGERWPVMPDPYDAPPGMLVLPRPP